MPRRTNFRRVGIGVRGKETHVNLASGHREKVLSVDASAGYPDALLESGIGRRLEQDDVLEVHELKTGSRRKFTGTGRELH